VSFGVQLAGWWEYASKLQIIGKLSRTCTANGIPEVGRELRAVISINLFYA